jgi:NAD(P)-dependent dehydrogenase (short-subunit alcohol dehydrogenase family)
MDLDPSGITVTDVQPGFVATDMTAKNEFKMPLLWTAEKAARVVCDRLERAPRIIAFPRPMDWLTSATRFMPYWMLSRLGRRLAGNR